VSSDKLKEVMIDKEEEKQKVLEILSDSYTRTILSAMVDEPKSTLQISTETKIPLTTVYRKLHHLLEQHMVQISGQITENGKKNFLYKSKLKSFHVAFSKSKFSIIVNTSGTCDFCLHSHE